MNALLSFVTDVLTCRSQRAKLVAENGRWKADVQFLTNENRRISREFLRAIGHPALRAETQRISLWN